MTAKSAKSSRPVSTAAKKRLGQLNLHQVFEAAKKTLALHSKLCIQLVKIYHKVEFDEFFSEFVDLLKVCLVVGEKHPQVERCLSFVASFTTCDKQLKEDKVAKKTLEESQKSHQEQDKEKELSGSQEPMDEEEEEEEDDVDEFLIKMFQFLLNIHEAQSSSVRYRVCQLINRILNSMGKSASLDDDLFNTIYDTMLERLMDKKPAVRVQAIHALNRLQDPTNKDCPVIKAYRYHLSMDPASEVRRAALCCTGINFQTLPDVLQRTRDKNNLVRRQAYMVLAQKVHIRSLQISQRVRLLSEGLNDRSDLVRTAVQKNLLNSWLRFVNGSVLDLLTCLDVEASTKEAELALDAIFTDMPASMLVQSFGLLDDDKLLPLDKLKPESALYWKCLAKHLKKEQADEELDFVLPDLSVFCRYTEACALSAAPVEGEDEHAVAVHHLERQFVLQQLLHITTYYDLADEVGRRSLVETVRRLLVCRDMAETSIAVLVEVFGRLYPPSSRVQQLAEIISDVRELPNESAETTVVADQATETSLLQQQTTPRPAVPTPMSEDEARAVKIQAARVRVELNEVREALEECVRSLDLDRAQELKLKLTELQTQHEQLQQQLATPQPTKQAEPEPEKENLQRPAEGEDAQQQRQQQQPQSQEEDAMTLSHCLTIVCEMLRSADINVLSPTLHSLHDNLLLPCLKNQDALVREMSVRALALLCIISKDLAQKHLPLFIQISQVDAEAIQIAAVQAVFDVLLLHGVHHFTGQPDGSADALEDTDSLISVLSKRLEEDVGEVRNAVAMGLCKLFNSSRLHCPKLLSQLTLLWYNPLTEDDTRLRQMLGSFFPVYASSGGLHQESLSASFLKTVRTLVGAPARSPFVDVDIDDVCSFLLSITSPAIVAKDAQAKPVNVHDSLVFTLCGEMLAHPNSSLTHHLCRALRLLSLTPHNFSNLTQVHFLLSKLMKRVRGDRTLMMPLEKFMLSVTELLKSAPAPQEDETLQDKTMDESKRLSAADESSGATNKTVDGSFARRKRPLYHNLSSSELLSSEAESEGGETKIPITKPSSSSSDTEQTVLEATLNEEEEKSCTVTEATDSKRLASDLEVQISGEWDPSDTTVQENPPSSPAESSGGCAPTKTASNDTTAGVAGRSPDTKDNSANETEFKTAVDFNDSGSSQSGILVKEENQEEESKKTKSATRMKKQRTTRSTATSTNDVTTPHDDRRPLAVSRRSRRAALRTPSADASSDEDTAQPPPSSRRAGVARAAAAAGVAAAVAAVKSSRGKTFHCTDSNSSGNSASPSRPALKRLRGTQASPVVSGSPASSVRSTRSTRSSVTSSDASSRRAVRSSNTMSPATPPRTTRRR